MDAGWLKPLKQRNVFRFTVLYAVTGYATFQISSTLLPANDVACQRELAADPDNGLRHDPPAIATTSPLDALRAATSTK